MKKLLLVAALVAGCHGARLDPFLYAPVTTKAYSFSSSVPVTISNFGSSDGALIWAVSVQGTQPYTLVYCHGNGTDIDSAWPRIELLIPLGWSIIVWDYRGYGMSTGTPSERGIHDDEEALYESMLQGKPGLVYYGRSFGGAVCIDLATRHPPQFLVEESTFTSVDDLVHDGAYVDLPRSYVADDSWSSISKMPSLGNVPFLALHGAADDYVQPKYSEELVAAHPGRNQLVLVPGADHSNVPDKMGDSYLPTLSGFVTSSAPAP